MPVQISSEIRKPVSAMSVILSAWLIAGTLDGSSAVIKYLIKGGKHPENIFKYIASAVFGKEASDETIMILIGIVFHYLIALVLTIFFFLIYPKIKFLSKNKIVTGLLYGIFVWLIMNIIVVPLSNTPKFPFNPSNAIIEACILMVAIGLPVSIIISNYYRRKVPINENYIR